MATPSGRFAASESRVSPNVSSAGCGTANMPDKALTQSPPHKGASECWFKRPFSCYRPWCGHQKFAQQRCCY